MPFPLVLFLLSAVLSFLLLQLVLPCFSRSFLDQPNSRSSHHQPTPRGGGIVFVTLTVLGFLFSSFGDHAAVLLIPIACFPLAIVGFLDDRFNLSSVPRYFAQLVTVLLLLSISHIPLPLNFSSILFVILSIFLATGLINLVNFMDGLDGLVASCMMVTFAAAIFILGLPAVFWVLPGSLFGFLFLNWSPARVFMGDVGSTFLGAVFSGLLLHSKSITVACSLLLVAFPILSDAAVCLIRRLLDRQAIFKPHRLHLYQRLYQAGYSHRNVALLYLSSTSLLSLSLLLSGLPLTLFLAVVLFLFGVFLDCRVAVPFST